MRKRRRAKTRMKLLGYCAATDNVAPFENNRFESALRQIECSDECVGTAPDKNNLLSDGHGQLAALFQSFRITWLAMRPFAPMMPPPGCVAEPHINRLSTGVL
jgi:hypothetical protein